MGLDFCELTSRIHHNPVQFAITFVQIVEGVITMFFGIVTWFYVPDFPDQNDFLSPQQTKLILDRVERDRGDSVPDSLTREKVIEHLRDWKIWVFGKIIHDNYLAMIDV